MVTLNHVHKTMNVILLNSSYTSNVGKVAMQLEVKTTLK